MSSVEDDSELTDQPREVATRAKRFAEGGDFGTVAAVLAERRNEILAQWLDITRRQPFHAGRTARAVSDHIPALFDAIVGVLQRTAPRWVDPGPPLDDPAILEAAQRHARARFEQGLRAADVLAEFRLMRQEIGRALRQHLRDDVPTSDVIGTELLVHDALDGAMGVALVALAQELEELREEILATTVHDIQQPITGLKARLQLALRTLSAPTPDTERLGSMIRHADKEADRMSSLLSTLATASRVALGELELRTAPTDLRELVQSAVDRLDPETAGRCRLVIAPELVATGAWDAQLLERVVANLLSNAVKYADPNSEIQIVLGSVDDSVQLEVRDQGIGLAPDELGYLFQRYSRTRRAREQGTEGVGLGLYVCRGIVEAHGGRIWAESPGPGQGTTVTVLLPR